jgi:hypothetical protein
LKIVGDEKDPSHVVIEANDSIVWKGLNGWVEGVTFRRPRISTDIEVQNRDVFRVKSSCSIHMAHCVLKGSVGSQRTFLNGRVTSQMTGGVSVSENGNISMHGVSFSFMICSTYNLYSNLSYLSIVCVWVSVRYRILKDMVSYVMEISH